jgi:hypothetical protein
MANQILVLSYQENSVDGDTVARIYDQLTPFGIELVAIPYREVGLAAGGKETVMPFVKTFGVVEEQKKSESRKRFADRLERKSSLSPDDILKEASEFAKEEDKKVSANIPRPPSRDYPSSNEASTETEVLPVRSREKFFNRTRAFSYLHKKNECFNCHGTGKIEALENLDDGTVVGVDTECPTCKGKGKVENFGRRLEEMSDSQKAVKADPSPRLDQLKAEGKI